MKIYFFFLLLIAPFFTFSQTVELSDSLITADGNPYAKIVTDDARQYTVYDLFGKAAIVIKYEHASSPLRRTSSNPTGTVNFVNFYFLESKQVAQLNFFPGKKSKAAKELVKLKFFKEGKLMAETASNFVLVNPVRIQ